MRAGLGGGHLKEGAGCGDHGGEDCGILLCPPTPLPAPVWGLGGVGRDPALHPHSGYSLSLSATISSPRPNTAAVPPAQGCSGAPFPANFLAQPVGPVTNQLTGSFPTFPPMASSSTNLMCSHAASPIVLRHPAFIQRKGKASCISQRLSQ